MHDIDPVLARSAAPSRRGVAPDAQRVLAGERQCRHGGRRPAPPPATSRPPALATSGGAAGAGDGRDHLHRAALHPAAVRAPAAPAARPGPVGECDARRDCHRGAITRPTGGQPRDGTDSEATVGSAAPRRRRAPWPGDRGRGAARRWCSCPASRSDMDGRQGAGAGRLVRRARPGAAAPGLFRPRRQRRRGSRTAPSARWRDDALAVIDRLQPRGRCCWSARPWAAGSRCWSRSPGRSGWPGWSASPRRPISPRT